MVTASFSVQASDSTVSVSLGAYVSEGSYGADDALGFEPVPDTKIRAFPVSISYRDSDWSLSLHSAYLRVTGSQSELFLNDDFEVESETFTSKRSGFSDISLKAIYKLPRFFEKTSLSIGTKVKIPTSKSSDNLSSGEVDYSVFLKTSTRYARNILGTQWGYQVMGDTQDIDYENRWFSRLSWQRILSKQFVGGLSYYFKQASRSDRDPIRKLNTNLSWLVNKQTSYTLTAGAGFSDTSPDWSGGIQARYKF